MRSRSGKQVFICGPTWCTQSLSLADSLLQDGKTVNNSRKKKIRNFYRKEIPTVKWAFNIGKSWVLHVRVRCVSAAYLSEQNSSDQSSEVISVDRQKKKQQKNCKIGDWM